MGRNPCYVKPKLRKGLWSPEEDEKLYNYITRFGVGCWSSVPKLAGLQRCGKSCRLRWINYLRPDLKRGMFSQEEEDLIMSLHEALGNRWAQIAAQLPGRTDNEIKNFWNSSLKKKLIKQGIDPNTHKPINQTELKDCQKDCTDSLPILATSAQIEQQTYNFGSKQVYDDPLFLPEFQANLDTDYYQSNFLCQNIVEGNFVNPTCGPDLAHFDHQNMMDSRMSKCVMKEGPSTFFWDGEVKLDSMFQFQFSGIQFEERRQNLWQEGTKKFDHQEDFSEYPLTTLSQELVTGTNLDVFQQI